jgi:hypothetical protein
VCVCAFSLRRESPDMILGDKPSFLRWFCHTTLAKEVDQGTQQETCGGRRKQIPGSRWCLDGFSKTQRRQLQKLRKKEIEEERRGYVTNGSTRSVQWLSLRKRGEKRGWHGRSAVTVRTQTETPAVRKATWRLTWCLSCHLSSERPKGK